MDETTPPATGADGDLYIVGVGATGAWAGQDNNLARFVDEGNFWEFFVAGTQVFFIVNLEDGNLYKYLDSSPGPGWVVAAGIPEAPNDGETYVRQSLDWVATVVPPLYPPVIDETDEITNALDSVYGNYTRFSHVSAIYHFSDAETYEVGAEYHGRYTGVGVLTITGDTGFTINPPAGGSLQIPQGGTFTVKIVAADEADLFGVTVPAT
jgi:hypothetical protein